MITIKGVLKCILTDKAGQHKNHKQRLNHPSVEAGQCTFTTLSATSNHQCRIHLLTFIMRDITTPSLLVKFFLIRIIIYYRQPTNNAAPPSSDSSSRIQQHIQTKNAIRPPKAKKTPFTIR